ncbi:MAG: site-specific integrase [Bacteroidota bacterium]
MDLFEREWYAVINRNDFILYMEKKIKALMRDREIKSSTYDNHKKTLTKLKDFCANLPFMDLDHNWAKKYDSFLKRNIRSYKTNGINTRWTHHKVVRTYMRLAQKEDHIKFENPYDYFTAKTADSTWLPIYEKDFKKLVNYYDSHVINKKEKRCLRRFLMSCCTSLRISDLQRVRENWLYSDNVLRYVAYKNRDKNKIIELPLKGLGLRLFQDAIEDMPTGSQLFHTSQEQPSNRMLKRIAQRLRINRNLHHHVGRSTFITLFLKNGGKLDMAQYYAGHHDIILG